MRYGVLSGVVDFGYGRGWFFDDTYRREVPVFIQNPEQEIITITPILFVFGVGRTCYVW